MPTRSGSGTTSGSRPTTATVVVARAIVSHRMPAGTVFMYHAKDRTVDVPRTGNIRGCAAASNSLTRLLIKPTHVVGGYAQLSFFLNHPGRPEPARRGHGDPPARRRCSTMSPGLKFEGI